MLRTKIKGNLAEGEIENALKRLQPDAESVVRIPNQEDPNHSDLFVALREPCDFFIVQAKAFSTANLKLRNKHIRDWLNASLTTVPMWWEDENRTCYWTDILRFRLRSGGAITRGSATFNKTEDLHCLNPRNERSSRKFLQWIRGRVQLWPFLSEHNYGRRSKQ